MLQIFKRTIYFLVLHQASGGPFTGKSRPNLTFHILRDNLAQGFIYLVLCFKSFSSKGKHLNDTVKLSTEFQDTPN